MNESDEALGSFLLGENSEYKTEPEKIGEKKPLPPIVITSEPNSPLPLSRQTQTPPAPVVLDDPLNLRQSPMVLLYRLQEACAKHANDDELLQLLADAKRFIEYSLAPVKPKTSGEPQQKVKKSFWTGKPKT